MRARANKSLSSKFPRSNRMYQTSVAPGILFWGGLSMTSTPTERRGKRRQRLKWYLFGPVTGLIAIAAIGYACAVLLERQVFPSSTLEVLTIASVFLGSTLGGIAAAKRRGASALEAGGLSGAVLAILVVLVALVAPGEGPATATCLRFVIATVAGGAFGGALCLDRCRAKRRKKRYSRR